MKYIKVSWLHNEINYPIEIYSELDNERYEIRKIEFFLEGKIGYAMKNDSFGKTMLGECPLPSLGEINKDQQFFAEEITKEEFHSIWDKYIP